MHGWCNCPQCVTEKKARNAYRIEDEYETPHKRKGRGKKVCKRSKDGKHDWTGSITKMVWDCWTEYVKEDDAPWPYTKMKKVKRSGYRERKVTVCAKCQKPQHYRYWW